MTYQKQELPGEINKVVNITCQDPGNYDIMLVGHF